MFSNKTTFVDRNIVPKSMTLFKTVYTLTEKKKDMNWEQSICFSSIL